MAVSMLDYRGAEYVSDIMILLRALMFMIICPFQVLSDRVFYIIKYRNINSVLIMA